MVSYPEIDPVAFSLGPVSVHWYGIMYLLAFGFAWGLAMYRTRQPGSAVAKSQVDDLIFYGAMGAVIGGRLGYVFFYNFGKFLDDPVWLFRVWEGGMSFHGGLLGVIAVMIWYARRIGQPVGAVFDFVAPLTPIGLGLGRLGNFIGQELWGRHTDLPWGMVFPKDPSGLARHPSQLYEAFLEGLLLFLVLWWFARRPRPAFAVSGLFLIFYGLSRFVVEFVREPDDHIGFDLLGWITRGQILTMPIIIAGIIMLVYAYRRQAAPPGQSSGSTSSN